MRIAILKHGYYPDLMGIEKPEFDEKVFDSLDGGDEVFGAKEIIQKMDSEPYALQHGESGRPTLLVVEDVDAEYIESGRNQDMSNYNWENAECECGECNKCIRMMILQDRDHLISNAIYKS